MSDGSSVMDTNDIDAAIAAAEHQGGYAGDYMANRLRQIKSIGLQRERDGIPVAVFPPEYTEAEGEIAKRIIAGIQRMHDRAWFVIEYADGTRDLVPTIPDDDLEDALRTQLGLPGRAIDTTLRDLVADVTASRGPDGVTVELHAIPLPPGLMTSRVGSRQCDAIDAGEQCTQQAVKQTWNRKHGDRSGGVVAYCAGHLAERHEDGDIEWALDI